jgi:hypothetical protein
MLEQYNPLKKITEDQEHKQLVIVGVSILSLLVGVTVALIIIKTKK